MNGVSKTWRMPNRRSHESIGPLDQENLVANNRRIFCIFQFMDDGGCNGKGTPFSRHGYSVTQLFHDLRPGETAEVGKGRFI
jgi:hypothetical protein